jgi:hypothetical protein
VEPPEALEIDVGRDGTSSGKHDVSTVLLRDPQAQYLVINLEGVEAGEQT